MPYPLDLIEKIAARHGLSGEIELLPKGGMVNEAWRIGESILRICREEEGKDEAAREAAVVPLLVDAGLSVPKLLAAELEPELTDLPYTIYERAGGILLGYCDFEPGRLSNAYRQVGEEIAKLGRLPISDETRPILRDGRALQPWKTLAKALGWGVLEREDGKQIAKWVEAIEPKLGDESRRCMIHMDIHPWNVFVDPDSDELTAIIDWGDASWGDPALEFASMPLPAVPQMLEGYAEAGGELDEGFVARALHAGVSLSLWELRELPQDDFDRRWWRMPPGGWPELSQILARQWPEHAPLAEALT